MVPRMAKPTDNASEKLEPGRRPGKADRSTFYARREAAKVLRVVLQGDARRKAASSIKSLVYSPSVKNKKATFALVCQTLKHYAIIKEVLESSNVLNSKWKKQEELICIIAFDIFFGQGVEFIAGDAEKFLVRRKDALLAGLERLLKRNKVKSIGDLVALYQPPDVSRHCYIRVNTLKLDVDSAMEELHKHFEVIKDDIVSDLLILPPNTDLHDHPLVVNGSVFIQGKASSMVAAALDPSPDWEVLDACSAPGNKTVHLAALMRGKGKIIACEMNPDRVTRLEETISLSGATNVKVLCGDFLQLNPKDPKFSKVRAILLDPSCSGSGTVSQRLDHLLPSHANGVVNTERLSKLAAFQRKALAHALSFPSLEKVVYSTCSVNQIENEDVVNSILPLAKSLGFYMETPFPQWPRRGLPVFVGSEHLLRMDPVEDKEGFFIALFVKDTVGRTATNVSHTKTSLRQTSCRRKHSIRMFPWKISRMLLNRRLSFPSTRIQK